MGDKAIRVREDVHRQVTELAHDKGCTLGELVEIALSVYRRHRLKSVEERSRLRASRVTFNRGATRTGER